MKLDQLGEVPLHLYSKRVNQSNTEFSSVIKKHIEALRDNENSPINPEQIKTNHSKFQDLTPE